MHVSHSPLKPAGISAQKLLLSSFINGSEKLEHLSQPQILYEVLLVSWLVAENVQYLL